MIMTTPWLAQGQSFRIRWWKGMTPPFTRGFKCGAHLTNDRNMALVRNEDLWMSSELFKKVVDWGYWRHGSDWQESIGISRWIFKNDLPYSHYETNSSYAPSTRHDECSVYQDMFEGEVERERGQWFRNGVWMKSNHTICISTWNSCHTLNPVAWVFHELMISG